MGRRAAGIELRSISNLILRNMKNFAHRDYVEKMTGTNSWIIAYLADNLDRDIFQKDLEEEFSITRSTASKVVNLMVKKGFIERQSVLQDARLKKLVLTPQAIELSKLIFEDGEQFEARLTDGFSSEELNTFFSFIERMKNNIR
jgi:DNA-binding MarR family transcriptional regulator